MACRHSLHRSSYEKAAGYVKVWRYITISLYQGSEVEIKKICSSRNDSSSIATYSSTENYAIRSAKTKDFLIWQIENPSQTPGE